LVAAKIPEGVIRETLSQIKVDGAQNPAKLFTYKMQRYALDRRGLDFQTKTFGVSRKRGKMTAYPEPAMIRNYPEPRDMRKMTFVYRNRTNTYLLNSHLSFLHTCYELLTKS